VSKAQLVVHEASKSNLCCEGSDALFPIGWEDLFSDAKDLGNIQAESPPTGRHLVDRLMGRLKTREWKTRHHQKMQGWKTREWKMWHHLKRHLEL